MNLRSARWGPILHAASLLFAAIPAIYELITTGNPLNLSADALKWIILAMGVYNAVLSVSRNQGAITLNKDAAQTVKAIQGAGNGNAMLVTTAEPTITEGAAPNLPAGTQVIVPTTQT